MMNVVQGSILILLVIFIGLLISGKFRPARLFGGMIILAYIAGFIEMPVIMAGFTNTSLITLILLLLISQIHILHTANFIQLFHESKKSKIYAF